MDPLSITTACISLTATITKTSITVSTFVRAVRSARGDLDGISRELGSLKTLLELLAEDAQDADNFPETLGKHIAGILSNCDLVLVEVQRLVDKYNKPGVAKAAKWTLAGSEDVAKLQLSLEAHKSALEIALEMVTLAMTREIKNDTTQIRNDTEAIKQDTSEILQEIARLRAQLPNDQAIAQPNIEASETMLARYLDDLTSYAETVCWSGEDSDTDTEETCVEEKPKMASTGVKLRLASSTPVKQHVTNEVIQKSKDEDIASISSNTALETVSDQYSKMNFSTPSQKDIIRPKSESQMDFQDFFEQIESNQTTPSDAKGGQFTPALKTKNQEIESSKQTELKSSGDIQAVLRPASVTRRPVQRLVGKPIEASEHDPRTNASGGAPSDEGRPFLFKAQAKMENLKAGPGNLRFAKNDIINITEIVNSANYKGYLESDTAKQEAKVVSYMVQRLNPQLPLSATIKDETSPVKVAVTSAEEWGAPRPLETSSKKTLTVQTHQIYGEIAVVKSYTLPSEDEEDKRLKIIREVEILGLFNHPHIVKLRYFACTSTSWLLYLDQVGYITLSDYISKFNSHNEWGGPARKFARQIGSAIQYCHMHCVHHNSLRAEKIIVDPNGDVKITGFGSLEIKNTNAEWCFDVFSFGTIIWHMIFSKPPWNPDENMDRYLGRIPTLLPPQREQCGRLLTSMLNLDSTSRYFSMDNVLAHDWMVYQLVGSVPIHIPERNPVFGVMRLRDAATFMVFSQKITPVVEKLTTLGLGTPEELRRNIALIVGSSGYKEAAREFYKQGKRIRAASSHSTFSGLLNRIGSGSGVTKTTEEVSANFYTLLACYWRTPALAMYYLAKEKMEREAEESYQSIEKS